MPSVTTDRINGLSTSVAVKAPVKAATTANITLSAEQTIDGISCVDGNRVLVKNQTDTRENGIYYVSTGTWTRAEDFDGSRDVVTGTTVFIVSGTTNGSQYWYVSTSGDPDPGEAMSFTYFASTESTLSLSDVTTGNVSTTKHGFAPKAPDDATKFLDGTGNWDTVKDSDLSTSDITTNNASASKHGFLKKLSGSTSEFMRGDGTWATPGAVTGTVQHYGALVTITSDKTGGVAGAPDDLLAWDTATYDTTFDPQDGGPVQKFWLGASFNFATTDVNTTNNTITKTAHGMLSGYGPFQFETSGGLPAGLSLLTNYWAVRIDDDTFKVATSRANAIAGTPSVVDITTQGTGTHTCDRGKHIVVPANVTKIVLKANLVGNSDLSGQLIITFVKNGSAINWVGNAHAETDTTGIESVCMTSADIVVTEGDRFSLSHFGSDAWTIDADTGCSWMSISVVTPLRIA